MASIRGYRGRRVAKLVVARLLATAAKEWLYQKKEDTHRLLSNQRRGEKKLDKTKCQEFGDVQSTVEKIAYRVITQQKKQKMTIQFIRCSVPNYLVAECCVPDQCVL
jgi:hypothetical protein